MPDEPAATDTLTVVVGGERIEMEYPRPLKLRVNAADLPCLTLLILERLTVAPPASAGPAALVESLKWIGDQATMRANARDPSVLEQMTSEVRRRRAKKRQTGG